MNVVNSELSKKLKEKGYPQNTDFYWQYDYEFTNDYTLWNKSDYINYAAKFNDKEEKIAAPTADEILDQLPANYFIHRMKDGEGMIWIVSNSADPESLTKHWERDALLANAAAKMYIYLKESELL